MGHILFIHSSLDGPLGCFPLVANVHSAAMNVNVHIFVSIPVLHSFCFFPILFGVPRSRMAGSCGDSMFNFLRSCQTVFHRGYTILHSHQQCTRVPISPYPCQRLLFSFFKKIIAILVGMRWYPIVILICVS